MRGDERSTLSGLSSQHVALAAIGLLAVLFGVLPATRPLVFVAVWLLAPVAAFGSLVLVFRGRFELRSARGIVFAMICGAVAFVTIPLGYAIASPTIGEPVTFFGLLSAIVAVGFAKLSVSSGVSSGDRDVPAVESFPDLESNGEELSRAKIEEITGEVAASEGNDAPDADRRNSIE
ncbi:hypothetical protein [Halovivax sp.]|uniref:hypothetical protein n=1 Tax=Halovivax sp. TaxID=1935978 RepID=UPI0025BCBD80|nr:hypothetical protein [Halovivax sp.]